MHYKADVPLQKHHYDHTRLCEVHFARHKMHFCIKKEAVGSQQPLLTYTI